MDYFEGKAPHINEGTLLAFGVPVTTRHFRADEMAEMLMFMQYAAALRLNTLVKEVFYDSNACICNIELNSEKDFYTDEGDALLACAERAIRQFDWNGTVHHGASLLSDED